MSEVEIIKLVAGNGPFAVLFVAYLFWNSRENAKREGRMMDFMEKVAPMLQQTADELRANTSVLARLEAVVHGCERNRDGR